MMKTLGSLAAAVETPKSAKNGAIRSGCSGGQVSAGWRGAG